MSKMYKVLVVDDEILVRQGIKHILNWEQSGYQIVGEASNGKEALGLIETLNPHIVLTDIVMPVMDGEELTRVIKQRWPEIEVIILSSFSEFEYVRSSFQSGVSDYILKPHLETSILLEVLNKAVDKIPSQNKSEDPSTTEPKLVSLLTNMLSGFDDQFDAKEVEGFFHQPYFYLLAAPSHTLAESEMNTLSALYPEMLIIELAGHRISGFPQLSLYLLNVNQEDRDSLPSKLKELTPSSKDGSVKWALSRSFEGCNDMGIVYRDSLLPLLQYRFFLPQDTVLIPDELPEPLEEVKEFQLYIFTEYIRRFQFTEAFQQLTEYLDTQRLYYKSDVFEFKSFIGNIVFNVIHVISNINISLKSLEEEKYTYFKLIDEAQHMDDIESLLDSFHIQIEQSVHSAKDQHALNPSMKLLLDYINEHYSEPITLTGTAVHFHFNPSYLSSFFATHHHEGFKEHLNRVRIDKAAELLRHGEVPISEIGEKVGYGDHSYFCKVFKKSTGMSPSQYRRQYYLSGETDLR